MNNIIIRLLQDKIEEYSILAKEQYEKYQYYCWDKNIRRQLIIILKTRSEYKRALKEYQKLCSFVTREKYKKVIEEYRKNPVKFVEDMYGVQLLPYQKIMLNMFSKKNKGSGIVKIKTPNQTHEFNDIREKTTKNIWGYYKGYYIGIEKADKRYQTKEKTVWSVDCTAPDGGYIYNGYFEGTMREALIDVFENIESCEKDKMECPKCKTTMENDDFYQDDEGKYFDIWVCPQCGERIDTPEDNCYN